MRFPAMILLALCGVAVASARSPDPTQTEAQQTAAVFARFDRQDSPGCAVAVVSAGRIIYQRGFGMADLEHRIAITPTSVFELASMSKQFTAMAIALLATRGKLSLDDDVRRFLPDLHDYGTPITIRQFIHHTSGVRDYLDLMDLAGWRPYDSVITQQDVLEIVSRQRKLNFPPGRGFLYENTGYALLPLIVERVAGMPFQQFCEQNIFRPLGMGHTRFQADHSMLVEARANGYEPHVGGGWQNSNPIYDEVGDGGLFSTVEDLARWDSNFETGEVGGPETIKTLLTPGRLADGRVLSYAFGLELGRYRGLDVVEHGGADPGYRCDMLRFPKRRLTVIVLSNCGTADTMGMARRVAEIYLGSDLSAVAEPGTVGRSTGTRADHSGRFAGRYIDPATGSTREFVELDGALAVQMRGEPRLLVVVGENEFALPNSETRYVFRMDPQGGFKLEATTGAEPPRMYAAVRPLNLTTTDLAAYAGRFANDDLGVTWEITVRDGALYLRRRRATDSKLEPVFEGSFLTDVGLVHFLRDPSRRVYALEVSNVRDRAIRFDSLPDDDSRHK
jgi:CubicO group peptidase (beta-lactamase class C family)